MRLFDVVVRRLYQRQNDVLHILAHITSFSEIGCIGNGKRYIEHPRQGLGEQGFTAAGRTEQKNVALLDFHIPFTGKISDPLIVIIYGHGKYPLGTLLPDYIVIEGLKNLCRGRKFPVIGYVRLGKLFCDNFLTQIDAFITDIHGWTCNELFHLIL